MQYFKGDEKELKYDGAGKGVLDNISLALDSFFAEAYACKALGELLYDQERAPLIKAIKREIFIQCFKELFEAWSFCGTFESYLLVLRKIFGEDADIVFTVPGPGRLQIDIVSTGFELSPFVARKVEDNQYVFDNVVDHEGNQLVFLGFLGIDTQYDLEQVLFTMTPHGIFTEVSITIGEP